MLRSVKDLEDYAIGASDGVIGRVKDLYFDDDTWVIRNLVVDTGSWHSGRKVLLSPLSIGRPEWTDKMLPVGITKEQVKSSPDFYTATAVSPQHNGDAHLRSCNALMRCRLRATDGDIGYVHGLLVDDETWAIRNIIVATSHWWAGHQVLIAPQWIRAISRAEATVSVNVSRQAVNDAPLYDAVSQLAREQELGVYDHGRHLAYWATQ